MMERFNRPLRRDTSANRNRSVMEVAAGLRNSAREGSRSAQGWVWSGVCN
jgi:hypothetical protein